MSFPSQGVRAWYRNPIREVARFMDRNHPEHYRVYNLCSERTYSDRHFHNRVFHRPIDDHNVPAVSEMVDFVREVISWLDEDEANTVAVHCKGGKGRTGTMICILLVELGFFKVGYKLIFSIGVSQFCHNFRTLSTAWSTSGRGGPTSPCRRASREWRPPAKSGTAKLATSC